MAILNATPDSFFEDSRVLSCGPYRAVERAGEALKAGAAAIDIGGQSTRPNAERVSAKEELARVLPIVEGIRATYKDAPISVDTFYREVAAECLKAGADMINDVSCLHDEALAKEVLRADKSILVMHNRRHSTVGDLFEDKIGGLRAAVKTLKDMGFSQDRILLDGGIGFNLSLREDEELLAGYGRLTAAFEEPFLIGVSRKSFFGGRVEDRLPATLAAARFAKEIGVLFVRVHDIKQHVEVLS